MAEACLTWSLWCLNSPEITPIMFCILERSLRTPTSPKTRTDLTNSSSGRFEFYRFPNNTCKYWPIMLKFWAMMVPAILAQDLVFKLVLLIKSSTVLFYTIPAAHAYPNIAWSSFTTFCPWISSELVKMTLLSITCLFSGKFWFNWMMIEAHLMARADLWISVSSITLAISPWRTLQSWANWFEYLSRRAAKVLRVSRWTWRSAWWRRSMNLGMRA